MYDELIKRLRDCTAEQNGEKTLWCQAADAIEELTDIRVGKWEESIVEDSKYDPYGFFKRRWYCSACGKWQTHGATKYCPNCGAKMESEVSENG